MVEVINSNDIIIRSWQNKIQEIFDEVSKTHRKIVIMGKNLQDIINKSIELKYLTINK